MFRKYYLVEFYEHSGLDHHAVCRSASQILSIASGRRVRIVAHASRQDYLAEGNQIAIGAGEPDLFHAS
jgi:hypothetical protein